MQVVLVCNSAFGTDGISMFVMNNHRRFKHDRASYHLIYSSIHSPEIVVEGYVKDFMKDGDKATFIPKRNGLINYAKHLYQYFKKEKIDVMHVHGSSSAILIEMVVAKFAGVKKVITHSHNTRGNHNIIHKILRPAVSWLADVKLACGESAGKWMYGKNGKFTIIPNCINTNQYKFEKSIREEIRKELGIDNNTFVIGHVGMFTEIKNHQFLIHLACNLNKQSRNDFKVIFVGHGELKDQTEKDVEKLGLSSIVLFLGNRNDVARVMMAMDVFCLPSLYEGFPIVAVEAQASGLPTIVSQNISTEVCITDLVTLLPVDEGLACWKEEIEGVMSKTIERSIYAEKVKCAGYDIEHSAAMLESVYKKE